MWAIAHKTDLENLGNTRIPTGLRGALYQQNQGDLCGVVDARSRLPCDQAVRTHVSPAVIPRVQFAQAGRIDRFALGERIWASGAIEDSDLGQTRNTTI